MCRFCGRVVSVLLAAAGLCGAVRYGVVTGRHPSSPLLQVPGSSGVQCALRCLTHTSCVSWEVTGSGCSLYRGVTSDPTAATAIGPLWADLWIPDGYQMVPNTNRAFRAHGREIAGASNLPAECAADHPRAAPAFLETEEQVNLAKSMITATVWTGIKEVADNTYGDYPNTRTVALPPEWFAPGFGYSIGLPCVRLTVTGLDFNTCGDYHGYICEYELL